MRAPVIRRIAAAALLPVAIVGCGGSNAPSPSAHSASRATATSPLTAPPPQEARAAAAAVLQRYESAYSAHDMGTLTSLLASGVTRRDRTPHGCVASKGRSETLSGYSAEFAFERSRYRLIGLASGAVQPTSRGARATVRYQFAPGPSGVVRFELAFAEGTLRIAHIDAACAARSQPAPGGTPAPTPPASVAAAPHAATHLVHPRPGCTVVLNPQAGPSHRAPVPSQASLAALCAGKKGGR